MLPDRMLMLTVGSGLEVPWPEPLTGNGVVFPKDYRMNAFPRSNDGRPRFDISDDEYFSWLADYLPANLPELSRDQLTLQKSAEQGRLSCFRIGDLAGWYENEAASRFNCHFPEDFLKTGDLSKVTGTDGGYTYEDYVEWAEEALEPDERMMTQDEWLLDEFGWYFLREEEIRQFKQYWPEFRKLDDFNVIFGTSNIYNEPPDAGWRVYLALVLQQKGDKEERVKEITNFYRGWQDMISK